LFSISALRFDFVRAIGDIQTAEYLLEFCYVGHLVSLSGSGGGVASPKNQNGAAEALPSALSFSCLTLTSPSPTWVEKALAA